MNGLVVDDDPAVARWVRRVFEDDGGSVDVAATADAGLDAGADGYRTKPLSVRVPRPLRGTGVTLEASDRDDGA